MPELTLPGATELGANMRFVTPAGAIDIVPLVVIVPPARPAPAAMLVTVPVLVMSSAKAKVFVVPLLTRNFRWPGAFVSDHRSHGTGKLGFPVAAMFKPAALAAD